MTTLLHFLYIHPDGTAAGEADLPGGLVGDTEFQHLRLARVDHVERLGDHRALYAAAGHRAEKIAVGIDHEIGADRPRRRAPGLDHGGERHTAPGAPPVLRRFENVFVAREHGMSPSIRAVGREYGGFRWIRRGSERIAEL